MNNFSLVNTSALKNFTNQHLNGNAIERSSMRLWFAAFIAISLIGILTNGVLFCVITRSRTLRSGAGILIIHVIINCLGMSVVHSPITAVLIYGDNFWFAHPRDVCKYVHFLQSIQQYANNWAEVSLAVNRLVAMIFPFAYKAWSTRKVTGMMIAVCWSISGVCSIPFLFEVGGKFGSTEQGQCIVIQTKGILKSFLTPIAIYVPYGVVGGIAVLVFLVLYVRGFRSHRSGDGAPGDSTRKAVTFRRRLNVTKMLLISVVFDVLCTVTQPMVQAAFPVLYGNSPLLRLWLRWCLALQFPVTPVILFAFSNEYRSHFWKWLRSLNVHVCPRNQVTPTNPSFHTGLSSRKWDTGGASTIQVQTRM
ncbi:hypothetical protein BV898_17046 [Hypsibius exemplaris]|uniref:G-protein coupled receptors family 1 profile domain-containing protein n=1 Tax=Hypsibius exemplaris TaxID=2072580 RepID=A0A9X6RM75_HYPEX|nr:hypothetical protein BV898_17046 [Hypsibius exemplaris]